MEDESVGWFGKLKKALTKTGDKISTGISDIFIKRKLDQDNLDRLEELLITADVGVVASSLIVSELSKNKYNQEVTEQEIKEDLSLIITRYLEPSVKDLCAGNTHKPQIVLVCGVNGNGKTTTIGKLAYFYQQQGKKILLAACDTFRAAAVNQLKVWAERNNCKMITGAENADPASVAYNAVEVAVKENYDILMIDTAGRLHNKSNLMEELAKIVRVIKKIEPDAPHNTILVLDATTGQNAHSQVEVFTSMVNVDGLIVTKLDGTAKAGVILSLVQKHKLNIYALGVGESIEDLRPFSAKSFANNLVGL